MTRLELAGEAEPLRVVVTFPFEIFPVRSGGALRSYYLLRELARHFDTEAIVTDAAGEIQETLEEELGEDIQGLRVHQMPEPKSSGPALRVVNRIKTVLWSGSPAVSTNAVVLDTGILLQKVVGKHLPHVAILTNLESWVCSRMLKKISPATTRIIDMHNVEHILFGQNLMANGISPETDRDWRQLRRTEANLYRVTDAAFTCSDEDRLKLSECNGYRLPCETIPNGVACEVAEFDQNPDKHKNINLLFCGTLSYPPNVDGLNWFVNEIFPHVLAVHPEIRLRVVGRSFKRNSFPGLSEHPSIDVIGEVDCVRAEYQQAGIALCPLRMGSGTRLKVLESMSFGTPTVSTTIGCEGIKVVDGETILKCDDAKAFADAINRLISSPQEFHALRIRARKFVEEHYGWKVIGNTMAKQVREWYEASRQATP